MNKLDIYIALFAGIFFSFFIAYFVICANISVAPSDWALMALAIVTGVEIVVASFIKIRKNGLDDDDRKGIAFIAEIVGKLAGVESPYMRSTEQGYVSETEIDTTTEECG